MSITQSSTEHIHILTPDVPLNHFSPNEAHEEEIRRNITMVLIGVILWDLFTYIPSDLKIIRDSRFSFVIFCFATSRLMILIYIFDVMLTRTIPFDDYHLRAIYYTAVTTIVCVIIASSYLFLRRVLAIYNTEKWVQRWFIICWVTLAITSGIVTSLGGKPALFPGAKYYMSAKLKPWTALSDWGLLIFDTAVMVAISLKLGRSFSASIQYRGHTVMWYNVLTGSHLPRFTRAILRGGQLYYLVTVGVLILVGVVTSLPVVSPVYGDLLATFFIFFSGSMACRVFRNTKLYDSDVEHSFSNANGTWHSNNQ